jgi:hypothetical protein
LAAALFVVLSGCSSSSQRSVTLTRNGTWTWFNDPRAIYDARTDRVYTGWITNTGTIQFCAYDLATRRKTVLDLKTGFEADDHNNPAFQLHDDGSVTAFYTAHRTEYPERAVLWRRIVPPLEGEAPAEPSARYQQKRLGGSLALRQTKDGYFVGPEQRIMRDDDVQGEKKNTYSNPFHLSSERRTYLFSRGANFNPVYRVHEDGAAPNAWSAAKNFILNAPNRPYVKYDSNGVDRISFLYTDANPGSARNNVYFMYLQAGVLHNADGSVIRKLSDGPIAPGDAKKVFDRLANSSVTGDSSWVWDLAHDPKTQQPIATFVSFMGTKHFYHYARFDGQKWIDHQFDFDTGDSIEGRGLGDNYSGGLMLDHTDPSIVYLSRPIDGKYVLEQWRTHDGGATWSTKLIAKENHDKILRPYVPLNRSADREMVLWLSGEYHSWDAKLNGGFHTSVNLWTSK